MSFIYLTPAAIGYLTQLILVLAITGFLSYLALGRPRRERPAHTLLLATSFAAVTALVLLFFLETASPPDRRLYAVYLQNTIVGLVLVLLVQFAYHFPGRPASRRWWWEARLALVLTVLYMLWELQFAVFRFSQLLDSGSVYFRPYWPDWVIVAGFAWVPVVFLRQAVHPAPGGPRASWLGRLWRPQSRDMRVARAFALVYMLPVGLSLTNALLTAQVISANFRQMVLSLGLLATLALFALIYLNSLPETTTFMIKLVGAALAALLAVLGAAGWLITPTYVDSYHPASPLGQTLRFSPNAAGGYDVAAVPYRFEREPGENLGLVDTGAATVNALVEYPFTFYGQEYREVYVADDGMIGLGAPVEYWSIQYHYGTTPAILALHLDLKPKPGESGVFAKKDAGGLTITWLRLEATSQPGPTYTLQLALQPDGSFEVSYKDLPAEFSFRPGADPKNSAWAIGAVTGDPAHIARQADPAALPVSGGPEGIVFDYYLAFRRHLHTLFAPLAQLILVGSLAILVGFPLLSYFNLVRPLNALLTGVRRVNAGDLDVAMPIQFPDEIGFLTQAFNRMVADLRGSIANLEEQVAQRTRQLADQNVDLTQSKAEAEERGRAAEAASRAKSVFLANMSHELRTPLNAILGFSQLLAQDAGLTAGQRENLAIITRSGEHLLGMLNDLLELSRIEAGRTELHPERFDLHLLLQGLYEMFHLRADQKGLQLRFERAAEVPRYIFADQGKLRQVLTNLLGNAVKFTSQGSIVLRTWSTYCPGNAPRVLIHFEVIDTGIGITPENQQAIFEPFVQLAQERGVNGGAGLGLSISRQFVQLMGGKLRVRSQGEPGQGSVFAFDLPVEIPAAEDLPATLPTRRAVGLEPGQPAYRLLVVEDHKESRELMTELLTGLGFEVRAVDNGQEAIAAWQEWQPHLIWMDVRLPVLDGCETTRRIKGAAQGAAPVIIALSAGVFEEDRLRILEAGGDGFLGKPVRTEEVVAALERHLGARFVYRELPETPGGTPAEDSVERAAGLPDLSGMPPEWVAALQEAVTAADADRIESLAEETQVRQPLIAMALSEALARFDYPSIQKAIDRYRQGL